MKYFLDTEFSEGPQDKKFLWLTVGKTKPTIDLISIGLVSEDGREYYAISKDFNLKEVWNRFDRAPQNMLEKQYNYKGRKIYWLRENVLKPIWANLEAQEHISPYAEEWALAGECGFKFTMKRFAWLIDRYGKTNRQIANEICDFIYGAEDDISGLSSLQLAQQYEINDKSKNPEFYAYYADYDWVVFCWLFGKMIDLPKGFPMYCRDLKQMLDEKPLTYKVVTAQVDGKYIAGADPYYSTWKEHRDYPKQVNEHNALADARWNKKLYNFLQSQ